MKSREDHEPDGTGFRCYGEFVTYVAKPESAGQEDIVQAIDKTVAGDSALFAQFHKMYTEIIGPFDFADWIELILKARQKLLETK